jgi:hypothetical protein
VPQAVGQADSDANAEQGTQECDSQEHVFFEIGLWSIQEFVMMNGFSCGMLYTLSFTTIQPHDQLSSNAGHKMRRQ